MPPFEVPIKKAPRRNDVLHGLFNPFKQIPTNIFPEYLFNFDPKLCLILYNWASFVRLTISANGKCESQVFPFEVNKVDQLTTA